MIRQYSTALDYTHQFWQDMGSKVAPATSYNFASTEIGRRWLEETWWKKIQSNIKVVKDLRYLGGHLSTTAKLCRTTIEDRCEAGLLQLSRLRYAAAESNDKVKAILTKVYAGILYGVEGSDITEVMTATISVAVIDVFRSKNDVHDADWFYSTFSNGLSSELDPTVQTLIRRCLEFRRALCKRPKTAATAKYIFEKYAQARPDAAKWVEDDPFGAADKDCGYTDPMKHPASGTNDAWKKQIGAKGPIGFLIQSVFRAGATLSRDFDICKPKEQRISLPDVPYQYIK